MSVKAEVSDSTIRVRGNVRHVFQYVSELEHMRQWYPGVADVQKLGDRQAPVAVGTRYWVEKEFVGFKLPMTYEVVDFNKEKRLVCTGTSDAHQSTDQLVFMPDPNDPLFTIVRYMSDFKLRQWRLALQPLVAGVVGKVPEQGLKNLQKLLHSKNSPLLAYEMADAQSKRTPRSSQKAAWNFGGMFGNGNGQDAKRSQTAAATMEVREDALGYYSILGLKQGSAITPDHIKLAYRKAALELHPDKQFANSALMQQAAAQEFARVQAAYDVLRDPEKKKLYDTGRLPTSF